MRPGIIPEKTENYEECDFMDCATKIARIQKRRISCKVLNSGLNIEIP